MESVYKIKVKIKKVMDTGLGHIFGANTINQILAFASNFIIIRLLSKSEYGIYAYAFNVYSFFALASGFGMESACLQVCSEKVKSDGNADKYMKFGILFGSGFNIFLGSAICLCAILFPFPLEGVQAILLLFAVMPFVTTLFNCMQTYFRYNLFNVAYANCSVINTTLILLGAVVGAIFLKTPGLVVFRELAMVLSICLGVCIYKFPLKRILKSIKITVHEIRDMLKLSVISMLNIATGQLLYLIDVFLVGMLIPDELVVASYKTATIIPNALLFIPSALVVYIYPFFAQKQDDKKWVKEKFYFITKYFAMANIFISIILIVFAPFVIRILFGAQYLDAVLAFRILSLSYFFSATFRKVIGNLLVTQRQLKVNFWIGIMEGILNIISNWILIHFLGSIGAAVTTLIICVVSSIVSVKYFISYLDKGIQQES